jgi:hypothetical protein
MKKIIVSDITLKAIQEQGLTLTFREQLSIAEKLDFAKVDAIELPLLKNSKENAVIYRTIASNIKNAIVNISTIISTLFNALNKAYAENQSIFDAKLEWVNGHLVSNVPVYRVISSGMLAGKMISSLAQGVSDVANLRIANKWNNEGVAIGFS